VRAGNNSTDEMGHLWIEAISHDDADRPRQIEEAVMAHSVEKYPDDYPSWLDLGELRLSRLDLQGSVSALESAVRVDPNQSQGHNLLGAALMRTGLGQVAIQQFERALEIDPSNVNARYNLVFALMKANQVDEAAGHMEMVVAAYPKDAALHNLWGELLAQQGKYDPAIAQFDAALTLDPKLDAARENRAETLARQGRN